MAFVLEFIAALKQTLEPAPLMFKAVPFLPPVVGLTVEQRPTTSAMKQKNATIHHDSRRVTYYRESLRCVLPCSSTTCLRSNIIGNVSYRYAVKYRRILVIQFIRLRGPADPALTHSQKAAPVTSISAENTRNSSENRTGTEFSDLV